MFTDIKDLMGYSDYLRNKSVYKPLLDRAIEEMMRSGRAQGIQYPNVGEFGPIPRRVIRENHEGYFRSLWSLTTKEERLVLYQLSVDEWANPKNHRAIRHLQRRGMIYDDRGRFRAFSRSFSDFVRDTQDEQEIQQWIAEQRESLWHSYRVGAYALAIGAIGFLWHVKPELFKSYLAGLVTLSGGAYSIVRLYAHIADRMRRTVGGINS